MDDIESYLQASLQKDNKLCKFIENTLNNGPSDNDEDQKQHTSFILPTSLDQDCGSPTIQSNHAPVEMNESISSDCNVSSPFVQNISGNEPELPLYFAESNDFERDCTSSHVKRLKRELLESAKRKNEQPKQRQFTGKPIVPKVRVRGMKQKSSGKRQRKPCAEKFFKA